MKTWDEFAEAAQYFYLSPEQLATLREFYEKIDAGLFDRLFARLPEKPPLEELFSRYLEEEEQRKFLFLLIASAGEKQRQRYVELGFPESMRQEISRDLRLWADKTMSDWGYAGLNPRLFSWGCGVLSGRILQFGRLQCEIPCRFPGEFSVFRNADGIELHPGRENRAAAVLNYADPVINLHIPASGPLLHEQCLESLRRIQEFAADRKYAYRAVICTSWILDPVWSEWNPHSNLAQFQKLGRLFELPGHDQTDEVIWRVFGAKVHRRNLEQAFCRTSMQRFVKDRVTQGGTFREFGFFILP